MNAGSRQFSLFKVAGAGVAALALVGAGLHFSAGWSSGTSTAVGLSAAGTGAQTVNCPNVQKKLPAVPDGAAAEVNQNLALLNNQISEADKRLAQLAANPQGGANFIQNAILGPLKDKRVAAINRIETAIGRITRAKRIGLADQLATCTLNAAKGTDKGANNGNNGNNAGSGGAVVPGAGLGVLANDCSKSKLPPHTGFQVAPACVSTAFGEVASQDKDPQLIISQAPRRVRVGQAFSLSVNTRNLVRDRFLGAAVGGYYVESSLLNGDGLVRGHFHTACRMLTSTTEAPDPAPAPAFFVATEDGKGGAKPDTVKIAVAGMPSKGTAECAVWAGDGSHRVPMMQRANQIPAIDVVRIRVN
jgi:hypothetical protein